MREIPVLNRLNQRFSPRGVQFVAVAPHSATQLRAWNTSETTTAFRTEPIRYLVFPECPDNGTGGTAVLCHTFSSRFGVTAYPGTVIVDRNGNLRMQIEGFPMRENPEETLKELTELIEGLLR
jgi:hypothetical protein